jgi:hypothetical protein
MPEIELPSPEEREHARKFVDALRNFVSRPHPDFETGDPITDNPRWGREARFMEAMQWVMEESQQYSFWSAVRMAAETTPDELRKLGAPIEVWRSIRPARKP